MRLVQSLLLLICFGLMGGCAQRDSLPLPPRDDRAVAVLDNHGGYAHAGRRVALHSDGSYTDTRHTDVVGEEKADWGVYDFGSQKTRLTLSPARGPAGQLCRVDYDDQHYWVQERDRQRITESSDTWFRQISLRGDIR
jgi:hypothetical protein